VWLVYDKHNCSTKSLIEDFAIHVVKLGRMDSDYTLLVIIVVDLSYVASNLRK